MKNKKGNVAITVAIVAIIIITAAVFVWLFMKKSQIPQVNEISTTKNNITSSVSENVPNNIANEVVNNISTTGASLIAETPVILQDKQVTWYAEPKLIKTPELFKKGDDKNLSAKAWEVGSFNDDPKAKLVFVAIDPNDPGGTRGYLFESKIYSDGLSLQPYSRYSSDNFLVSFDSNNFGDVINTSDNNSYERIDSLEYPGFLSFNNMVFQYEDEKLFDLDNPFFNPEKSPSKKIYTDKIYGDVFLNSSDGGIYLKSPIGIAKVYSLKMNFFNKDTPQINWNDGIKTQDPFTYKGVGGCGGSKYADDASQDVSLNELAVSGKTSTGDDVYEYKDKNAEYLKNWYQENSDFVKNSGDADTKFKKGTTYDQFISNHLVFFWKDPFGRLIRFVNTDYVYGGGCGKPVIYLYPTQTENVSVEIMPTGGMTVSDPTYNQGWNVSADPNSNLTNLVDGKKYPYLFWEGRGDQVYQMPEKGFVTSRENLENLLNEKLSQFGLNQKEIGDFKNFWLPRMLAENKPYYFVTFVPRQVIDALAPLKINPKPETVIRVLMDYKGLDNYEDAQGFTIATPERKGFTAVEWGGVLR